MSQQPAPNPPSDADQLDAAADQAIAACGGDVRGALKAMIVANGYVAEHAMDFLKTLNRSVCEGVR